MEPRRIDSQIREFYEQQGLSADARARLKGTITAGAPRRSSRRVWIAAAAVAVIALASMIWTAAHRVSLPARQVADSIARQAAAGHNEKQELEFRVGKTAELRGKMKSLDFSPVEPEMIISMKMRIVGARYATLGGKMAAQILYIDEHGVPCTLFEVRPLDQLATVGSSEHQVDGVRVNVWREKGLVMVLARPMA